MRQILQMMKNNLSKILPYIYIYIYINSKQERRLFANKYKQSLFYNHFKKGGMLLNISPFYKGGAIYV